MKVQTLEQIKIQYPNEWVLIKVNEGESTSSKNGEVLLHGTDYLELCYKSSEVSKDFLTTILFTGETSKNRKWLKSIRLQETPKMI